MVELGKLISHLCERLRFDLVLPRVLPLSDAVDPSREMYGELRDDESVRSTVSLGVCGVWSLVSSSDN